MAEQKKPQRSKKAAAKEAPQPGSDEQAEATQEEAPQGAVPEVEAPAEAPEAEAQPAEAPQAEAPPAKEPEAEAPPAKEPEAEAQPAEAPQAEAPPAKEPEAEAQPAEAPQAEAPQAEATPEAPAGEVAEPEQPTAEQAAPEKAVELTSAVTSGTAEASAEASEAGEPEDAEEAAEPAARAKPSVPGAHLEVDIVPEGVDPLGRVEEEYEDRYALEEEDLAPAETGEQAEEEREEVLTEPIASAAIDLAAGARYRATGKRKTAIARVTLRPGSGTYLINGRTLEEHFPRSTLQRNIRQPLETVGYQERMDVVARLHGGGISAQAGALRHGVSRALLEADPNLRGELKRRGFLTRDSRAKERKKAGLKKARKRPQFSKR
jgi:small subunit ribosomal protein S9